MYNNPETLKYKIGQTVVWKDNLEEEQQGQVTNVAYWGLEVSKQDRLTKWVPFDSVVSKA